MGKSWEVVSVDWLKGNDIAVLTDFQYVFKADCRILINTHLTDSCNDFKIIYKKGGVKETDLFVLDPKAVSYYNDIALIVNKCMEKGTLDDFRNNLKVFEDLNNCNLFSSLYKVIDDLQRGEYCVLGCNHYEICHFENKTKVAYIKKVFKKS